MHTNDIRKKYLEFFESKGHVIVPSALLVPENDPTTLFTGSGMQPIVPYLLGEKHPLGTRITNSQKCFRSQDIEEVGDNRHTTFFEMLGNWSFGDYFKEKQITWMWEFLTEELKLDYSKLYFTCFKGNSDLSIPRDIESAELWQRLFKEKGKEVKIGENPENGIKENEHIFYYSEYKNWWSQSGVPSKMPVGEPGGPDTEMFWDFGIGRGLHEASQWKEDPCHVNCDCGRFMEIGNNVFMEYKKTEKGFEKLTQQNVDFGGGLERMAAAVADDPDVFSLDIFTEVRGVVELLSSLPYVPDLSDQYRNGDVGGGKLYPVKNINGEWEGMTSTHTRHAYRVILDHLRSATFLVGDGVLPSNKDQGYFVRRLIRRAVRYGNALGIKDLFTGKVSEVFISQYADQYPILRSEKVKILAALNEEEKKFRQTLENGLRYFKKVIAYDLSSGKAIERKLISGALAFDLYQTYGFPIELIIEEAKLIGLDVDVKSFNRKLEQHQDLSRTASAGKFKGGLGGSSPKITAFHTATHLMLAALRKELGPEVHQAGSNITEERTRFDFTWPEKVSREILDRVESYVNEAITAKATVGTKVMEKDAAKAAGVEGSFWEKYPDKVTVYQVEAPDGKVYSRELCGGPHVTTTADIATFGKFKIIKEEASSAGVRRIKAILE